MIVNSPQEYADAFADVVAGALIDGHAAHPPRDNIERRRNVIDLLLVAVDVYLARGETSTAQTIAAHAYALDPIYVAEILRRRDQRELIPS